MDKKLLAPTTALLLIDLQHSTMARQLAPHTSQQVRRNSVLLANSLRGRVGTVIFVPVLVAEISSCP